MSRGRFVGVLALALILVAGVISLGLGPRLKRQRALAAESAAGASRPPLVRVARVERAAARADLDLPADLQALIEAPIFARVEGYISQRAVDIGSRVKKGQLMAELETPELDQQLRQAQATLSQARAAMKQSQAQVAETRASLNLAQITAERWRKLTDEGVLSRQDTDEKEAQRDVKRAELDAVRASVAAGEEAVRAAEANVSRLQELKAFSRLTAPFDGIVTYRNPDVGTLISPGANGHEMFRVADISVVRAFVNIPQSHVPFLTPGLPVALRVDDMPGRTWKGEVANIAHELDPNTRTMLAIVRVENPDLVLKPGMYTRLLFSLPSPPQALRLPGDSVMGRNDGSYVAVVGSGKTVHYRKVEIGRDFGSWLAVTRGVDAGDLVVLSPGDEVREGTVVETRE